MYETPEAPNVNPFVNHDYSVEKSHNYTDMAQKGNLPFKTLNRILDDIKWTIPYRTYCNDKSLLNSKPIDYGSNLASLVSSNAVKPDMIMLNNELGFCPHHQVIPINDNNENQTLTVIRGLVIINRKVVNHFMLQILENKSPFFTSNSSVNKYEYHILQPEMVSQDDANHLISPVEDGDSNLVDDAFFGTNNEEVSHILRVSILSSEFSDQDLKLLLDPETISTRYLLAAEKSNLDSSSIPNGFHCIKKLLNVLKGPIIMDPSAPIKTIDIKSKALDSLVDIEYLTAKLHFSLDHHSLTPPNLSENLTLREIFIRKVLELIYRGKQLKVEGNDFDSTYSFNQTLSVIYRIFNEVDRHAGQNYGHDNTTNEMVYYIALSCSTFYQDELIIKCFENTVNSDPANKMFYVDHLKSIIRSKSNNSKLKSYYDLLYKQDELYGFSDYQTSLKKLGIDIMNRSTSELLAIEDDFIISIYESNIKQDFKNYAYFNSCLRVVGYVKNSRELMNYLNTEILPVSLALSELGVEEITEDEVVITAYEFKINDLALEPNNNDDVMTLNKSLLSLGVNRKSYIIMNYIEHKLPHLLGTYNNILPAPQVCEILDISIDAGESEVINKFQHKYMSSDIRVLRQALRSYNNYKQSKILLHFLQDGKIDSSLLPADEWPAGLDNIGNTCYLNSLLQYYFSIKPIRDMVLEFEEHENLHEMVRKIGGRKVEDAEIARSNQFVYHLQKLFNEMIHSNRKCVAPSKDLAFLSFLPSSQEVNFVGGIDNPIVIDSDEDLIEISDGEEVNWGKDTMEVETGDSTTDLEISNPTTETSKPTETIKIDSETPKTQPETISDSEILKLEIENAKIESETDLEPLEPLESIKPPSSKLLPISVEEMESTLEIGRQQDVTECIENVNFQLETASEPIKLETDGEQFDLIKRLFYGQIKQTITPLSSGEVRTSIERFSSIIINISDHPKDIYDALDNYFNADVITLGDSEVKKTLTINELPEILQFQVQRVLFDRERAMAYKSIEPIPFTHKLYVDRYLDTEDKAILDKREEVFVWKSQIRKLKHEKQELLSINKDTNLSIIDSLITTKKYLENIQTEFSIKNETIEYIDTQITQLKEKVTTIDDTINQLNEQITNQFENYKNVGYSIFAIFIHRGEASYGHYWIYIKDPHNNNIFRKYNDEDVSEVPESEVFNFLEGNTATPYYIAYVKEELEGEYVEPLNRVIECSNSSD